MVTVREQLDQVAAWIAAEHKNLLTEEDISSRTVIEQRLAPFTLPKWEYVPEQAELIGDDYHVLFTLNAPETYLRVSLPTFHSSLDIVRRHENLIGEYEPVAKRRLEAENDFYWQQRNQADLAYWEIIYQQAMAS